MGRTRRHARRLRGRQGQRGGGREEREAEVGDAAVSVRRVQGLGGRSGSLARAVRLGGVRVCRGGRLAARMIVRVVLPLDGGAMRVGMCVCLVLVSERRRPVRDRAEISRRRGRVPVADKVAVADFVIDNAGSKAELATQVADVIAAIRALGPATSPS